MSGWISFLREGLKNLRTVGTVTRSSPAVCRKMVSLGQVSSSKVIIELGAGDGVITHYILQEMAPDARLFAFELNPIFCEQLRSIGDDRLTVIEGSVLALEDYMAQYDISSVDTILSAIPFAIFSEEDSRSVLVQCHSLLAESSHFIQLHYSLSKKSLYESIFGAVNIHFVLANFPPAWVLKCG